MTDRNGSAPGRTAVAVVLKGYPRLSETFIAQEILALQQRGLYQHIVSLRHPTDRKRHPMHDAIRAPVLYLPEYLYQEPLRVLRAWWRVRRRPAYRAVRRQWLRDWRRDRTPNRGRRFGQALVLAAELPADIGHLHAHFLHTPASVTRYAAALSGLSWSVSAHAKDIWTSPEWEKREKLADCAWAVTCTAFGAAHLQALAPAPERVELLYHGLDLGRFPPPLAERGARDGSDPGAPARLLSVGRAVPKKGYDDLLDALARLPADLAWHLTHIGGGKLARPLQQRAERLGIAHRITWQGSQAQEAVVAAYREADLFVLASKVADDGDRDGLPNVLMEAQSQGLACLATTAAGIPELIRDGETGRLVPPGDPAALADALAALIRAPQERARLGLAGAAALRQRFSFETG
ncbi:MAG: glycosyltransferase, partial [Alphaproteobacteria bacterium]|nr:glycosyltransferase [Alphaproteobacteria bacterium]